MLRINSTLPAETERTVNVSYRGTVIAIHRIDLFVEREVVVELKALRSLDRVHLAQVLAYLKAAGARVGLLVNFNVPVLKEGLRRIVN